MARAIRLVQVLGRPPEGGVDGHTMWHVPEPHRKRPRADADNGDSAGRSHDGSRQLQRGVDADDVEHELGAGAGGVVADCLRCVGVRPHDMICANLGREVQLGRIDVDGDDLDRRQPLEQLDGEVTEPADADHHGPRPRNQAPNVSLDGVVRGETCVGQRCPRSPGRHHRAAPDIWRGPPRTEPSHRLG